MTKIGKWGDRLALRIPARVAEQLQIAVGTAVEMEVRNGVLLVRPRRTRRKYRLKDLLKNCKPSQLHGEINFEPDLGRESLD